MRTIALRLRPGADLKAELLALAVREHLRAGWVLTCVGSLSRVRLRLAGGAEHATWQGPFEIVALTGTLSQDGGHLHLAVADHQGRTLGGHLAEGCTVRTTAEVILAADDRLLFAREHDPATGYDDLVVRKPDPLRPGTATGPRSAGPFDLATTGLQRHAQRNSGWIHRFWAENSSGISSSRCHSVPFAATCWTAILGADLHEWADPAGHGLRKYGSGLSL